MKTFPKTGYWNLKIPIQWKTGSYLVGNAATHWLLV